MKFCKRFLALLFLALLSLNLQSCVFLETFGASSLWTIHANYQPLIHFSSNHQSDNTTYSYNGTYHIPGTNGTLTSQQFYAYVQKLLSNATNATNATNSVNATNSANNTKK